MTAYTRRQYTSKTISASVHGPKDNQKKADVIFEGDSRDVLRGFPDEVKEDIGYALFQLELGQSPPDRKPVRTVGPSVYELREADAATWYRLLYERRGRKIYVLHCFRKASNAIEQNDINTAKRRRSAVLEREREARRNVKRAVQGGKKK
jgi:phage-related protein